MHTNNLIAYHRNKPMKLQALKVCEVILQLSKYILTIHFRVRILLRNMISVTYWERMKEIKGRWR